MQQAEDAVIEEQPPSRAMNALVGTWSHLPTLAVLTLLTGTALGMTAALVPIASPLFPVALALFVAPASTPLLAAALSAVDGTADGVRASAARAWAARGAIFALTIPAGLAASLTSVTVWLWSASGEDWLAIPFAVGVSGTVALLLVGLPAVAVVLREPRAGIVGAWTTGSVALLKRPIAVVAALGVVAFVAWIALAANLMLILLLAPLGAVASAYLLDSAHRVALAVAAVVDSEA